MWIQTCVSLYPGQSGSIPSELGLLTNAYMMYLSHNEGLTGSMPSELLALSHLEALDIRNTSIAMGNTTQRGMSFYRYHYECQRLYPCQDERPEGSSNSAYERPADAQTVDVYEEPDP